jgi:hypothetical protein
MADQRTRGPDGLGHDRLAAPRGADRGITQLITLHGFLFLGDGRHYRLFSDLHFGLYGLS